MKVSVGTRNQKKLDAVERLFAELLGVTPDVLGVDVESGVAEAPIGDEIIVGAENRAKGCAQKGGADYYIGLESGLVQRFGDMYEESWAILIDSRGELHKSYSSGLMLPRVVTDEMSRGKLHNEIMRELDIRLNLPDDNKDTWSRYSGGKLSRMASFEEALRNALVQISDDKNSLYLSLS